MAKLLLIRHGNTDWVDQRLAGRTPGISLNEEGRSQVARLPDLLGGAGIECIVSSPLERTLQSAAPLAARLGLEVEVMEELTEVDYGEWTGRTFRELAAEPRWQQYNAFRSGVRIPGGELALDVQARGVEAIERLHRRSPGATVAVMSHGDVIRSALAYFLGAPLDLLLRFEVSPASISVLALTDRGPRVLGINLTAENRAWR